MTADDADTADHRPDVYREDGRWIFRASSLGSCDRRLILAAIGERGEPWPDNILRAMAEGVTAEPIILGAVKRRGWNLLEGMELNRGVGKHATGHVDDTGQLCLDLDVGVGVVRCHPDGVGVAYKAAKTDPWSTGELRVVEAKALANPPKTEPWLKGYGYDWQISVEMAATGLRGLYAVGAKEEGVVTEDDVALHVVDKAPYNFLQIKQRVKKLVDRIEEAIGEGRVTTDCNKADFPCPFYRWHDGQEIHAREEAVALEFDTDAEANAKKLRMLLGEYEAVKFNLDAAEKHKKKLTDEIRALASTAGNWQSGVKFQGANGWEIVWRVGEAPAPYTVTPKPVDRVELRKKKA